MRRIASYLCLGLLAAALAIPALAAAETVETFASGLNAVRGLAYDGAGNLYAILRSPSHKIVRYALPSNVPTTVTTTGFSDPLEGTFGDDGNLYVTDYTGNKVRKVTPSGTITDFATVTSPGSITRDVAGNFYVGEYFSEKILKITPAGVVTTYVTSAGAGTRLTTLYMDTDGTLYAGMLTGEIYKIAPGGAPITTLSTGLGSVVGFAKGPGTNWYASTYDLNTIRSIPAAGGASSLYAGASTAGLVNGPLLTARFNWPSYLLTCGGVMYIAEWNNDDIRKIDYSTTPTANTSWGRLKALYH